MLDISRELTSTRWQQTVIEMYIFVSLLRQPIFIKSSWSKSLPSIVLSPLSLCILS